MSDGDWLSETAYEYVSELSPAGLGWEFLRRDAAYQYAFDAARSVGARAPEPAKWGLVAYADPALSALEQPVFWRPEIDPRTVVLAPAPPFGRRDALRFEPDQWPGDLHACEARDGLHLLLRCGGVEHRLWTPEPLKRARPFAILLPADDTAPIRAEAALRFWRCITRTGSCDAAPAADPRAKRFGRMLRAFDARRIGVSYRALAEILFGRDRIDPATWKTSSVRGATIRLARSGAAFVEGDYRRLLGRPAVD